MVNSYLNHTVNVFVFSGPFHHGQMRVVEVTGTQDKQHMLSTDICKLLTMTVGAHDKQNSLL